MATAGPTAISESQDTIGKRSGTLRLGFLDGLRAVAALYVVLSHLYDWQIEDVRQMHWTLPKLIWKITNLAGAGRCSVAVFIVLSGYCLMLPVARSAGGILRGGAVEYLKRRARRILPPYYAALGVALGLLYLAHKLKRHLVDRNLGDNSWAANTSPGSLVSHLLLVHNLNHAWVARIDFPLWSVAPEWQIYFLFPLILLPAWRRMGIPGLLVTAFAIGLAPHFLLPHGHNFDWTAPWFIGLFSLGMASADISIGNSPQARQLRERAPWGAIALVGCLGVVPILPRLGHWTFFMWQTDTVLGVAVACLMVWCAGNGSRRPSTIVRILESRPLAVLASFSYSLYLVHEPIIRILSVVVERHVHSALMFVAILWTVVFAVAMGFAYLFYLLVERRFTSHS